MDDELDADGPEWDYWPCACTRTFKGRRQFKMLHRSENRCRKCKCERPEFIKPTRKAK